VSSRLTPLALGGLLLVGALLAVISLRGELAPAPAAGAPELTDAARRATLRFAPGVRPAHRDAVLAAIADARPEARRMIAEVDGLLEVDTQDIPVPGAAGLARSVPGGYAIHLDMAAIAGNPLADRRMVILHELGHVVEFALVSDELLAILDRGVPAPTQCAAHIVAVGASCAEPAERFADTFAKWALRGAVAELTVGYGVPTPVSLEAWGAPLAALAAEL